METIQRLLGGSGGMILYLVVIIAVFYFLLIRPQKKREKEAKNMMDALKKGDKIVTIGGFYGKIVSVKDDVITLNLGGENNKVKIEKSAVRMVVAAAADIDEEEKEDATEE